jgi:hypothetical protein
VNVVNKSNVTVQLDPTYWVGKHSKDVVAYLLQAFKVEKFFYRAYISNMEDELDKEEKANDLSDLDTIAEKYKKINPKYLISFQSKVLFRGEYMHFPMIDFSNSIIKEIDVEMVKKVLRDLGEENGFILNSGRCFHYYGCRLIKDSEWRAFTENCKKHPEIGENYPNRQLGRGKSSLRLVTSERKPKIPEVLEIFSSKHEKL